MSEESQKVADAVSGRHLSAPSANKSTPLPITNHSGSRGLPQWVWGHHHQSSRQSFQADHQSTTKNGSSVRRCSTIRTICQDNDDDDKMIGQKRDHKGNAKRFDREKKDAPKVPIVRNEYTSMFEQFRQELDEHHDRRERIVKASRDITALSKKM